MNSVRWMRAALGGWMVVVPAMLACGGNDAGPAGVGTAGSDGGGGGGDAGRGGAGGASDSGGSVDGGVVGTRVFDPATLHELAIIVATGDLPALDVNTDERVRCTVTLDGMTVADAGCRKKGMTSVQALSAKPGFTIKMNAFVSGQKLDGLKKLTVDNAKEDPSLLTAHLGYEVYRRAGLPAPRTSHATVTLNGADKGIYVLEESTNADYLETHFGDGSGNLYEGPWDFPKGVSTADLKDEVSEMRTRGDLEALTSLVMNTPDADLATALDLQLDVGRFITNFAVEEAMVLWDNYAIVAWNYYLYHVPGGRFVMLTHGVNWPYWHADFDPFDLLQDPWHTGDPPGYLCVRTLAVPALRERYRAELVRVARDALDVPALLARIDRVAATLKSRPLTGDSANDLGAHQAHVEEARAFVRDRRAFLAGLLGF